MKMFESFADFKRFVKEHKICFLDLRFTDFLGKWRQITVSASIANENFFENGITFDASSVEGWESIANSDLILIPEIDTAFLDAFTAQPTLSLVCNVHSRDTKDLYSNDPRSTAIKAERYLKQSGIADIAYFGPELEFFVFDSACFEVKANSASYDLDSEESPYNSGRKYEYGNNGHRPSTKNAYFVTQPIDSLHDLRSEILSAMHETGIESILHHHEVAPSQGEISFKYGSLVKIADIVQRCKYITRNVAHSYGKTATFMPKPIKGDNGSGMHCHASLWKDGKNIFSGDGYAGLSEESLFYIGGIFKHIKALNAFTNSGTNSYKRLISGFEAPNIVAYSAHNRSAAIRIPYVDAEDVESKRIELRFVDAISNPYLALSAIMMAGIDGIKNRIHPGDATNINLYELSKKESNSLPKLASDLSESLSSLDQNRQFLMEGGVFSNTQISNYIALKREEIDDYKSSPHPIEFLKYYSS